MVLGEVARVVREEARADISNTRMVWLLGQRTWTLFRKQWQLFGTYSLNITVMFQFLYWTVNYFKVRLVSFIFIIPECSGV